MDRVSGQIYASLTFGQNILEGSVFEDGIISYNVFMVDDCNMKTGDALATVPVLPSSELPDNCCKRDAYAVDVAVDLPVNYTAVRFMIVPETSAGMLTVGAITDFIVDDDSEGDGGSSGRARGAASSSAFRPSCNAVVLSLVIVTCLALPILARL